MDCAKIVSIPDLPKFVLGATWLPNPVDVELFFPQSIPHPKTVVGCYDPPNPHVRSFSIVAETLAAVRRLQRYGVSVDKKLLFGHKHCDVPRYFHQIDVWIDKFDMNFYGLCALEASLCEVPG